MEEKKEEILACAERTLHYTNLLIAQCDSWLSAEEGQVGIYWHFRMSFVNANRRDIRLSVSRLALVGIGWLCWWRAGFLIKYQSFNF